MSFLCVELCRSMLLVHAKNFIKSYEFNFCRIMWWCVEHVSCFFPQNIRSNGFNALMSNFQVLFYLNTYVTMISNMVQYYAIRDGALLELDTGIHYFCLTLINALLHVVYFLMSIHFLRFFKINIYYKKRKKLGTQKEQSVKKMLR